MPSKLVLSCRVLLWLPMVYIRVIYSLGNPPTLAAQSAVFPFAQFFTPRLCHGPKPGPPNPPAPLRAHQQDALRCALARHLGFSSQASR